MIPAPALAAAPTKQREKTMSIYALGDVVPRFGEGCWVAHNATVIGNVEAGREVNIWYNVVIRGDHDPIVIGDGTNIQDGSVLHNDEGVPLTIGKDVTVGHKVMLHGCTIGDETLIGINAVVLNNAVIGRNCIIGANALIPEGKVIPDRSLVVGSPGRIIRELSEQDIAYLKANAKHYVANARRYEVELRPVEVSGLLDQPR
jgi:carbonic anhydrase/acetyltransferase-like protein (isoleucine patch superfamily)